MGAGCATSRLLNSLLFFHLLSGTIGLPTLGHVDRNRLETYEDLSGESNDLDRLFGNLTFRFSCENMPIGLYADVDYNCRVFHACDDTGKGFPVICPRETFFNQRERICTDEEGAECERASEWFHLNELPYSAEVTEAYEPPEKEDVPSVLPLLLP